MLICKNCGAGNGDDCTFCASCGSRLDGKRVCPSCGRLMPEANAFCTACGAAMEGRPSKLRGFKPFADEGFWDKLLAWLAAGGSLFAAFFAFVFVFCIGTGMGTLLVSDGLFGAVTADIYYYVGEVYRDVAEAISAAETNSGNDAIYAAAQYIQAALGTTIAALTLVGTLVFAVWGMAEGVRTIVKGEVYSKKAAKLSLAATVVFIVGSLLLTRMTTAILKYNGVGTMFELGMNGATKAGIALTLIGVIASALASAVRGRANFKGLAAVIRGAGCGVAALFCLVVVFVGGGCLFEMAMSGGSILSDYMPIYHYLFEDAVVGEGFVLTESVWLTALVYAVIAEAGLVACVVAAGTGLYASLSALSKGRRANFVAPVVALAAAVISLTCAALFAGQMGTLSDQTLAATSDYALGGNIALVVLSAICLAAAVAAVVLPAKIKEKAAPAQTGGEAAAEQSAEPEQAPAEGQN